jgi:hypothetical protein
MLKTRKYATPILFLYKIKGEPIKLNLKFDLPSPPYSVQFFTFIYITIGIHPYEIALK